MTGCLFSMSVIWSLSRCVARSILSLTISSTSGCSPIVCCHWLKSCSRRPWRDACRDMARDGGGISRPVSVEYSVVRGRCGVSGAARGIGFKMSSLGSPMASVRARSSSRHASAADCPTHGHTSITLRQRHKYKD